MADQISSMTVRQLKDFLDDVGIDYTGSVERADLEELARAILDSDYMPEQLAGEDTASPMHHSPPRTPVHAPAPATSASSAPTNAPDLQATPSMLRDVTLVEFCSITGCDPDIAPQFLDPMNWDLDRAVQFFLDPSSVENTQPTSDLGDFERVSETARRSRTSSAVEYDADGIRVPDAIVRERLVESRPGYSAAVLAHQQSEDASVEWLFPPPHEMIFPGPLEQARQVAMDGEKWVIVNIQGHDEFASHQLNRDTWTHDAVVNIIRTHFIFWQRGSTSPEGMQFMQRYHLSPSELPHIAMLDPRTGSEIVRIKGFVEPGDLAMAMVEFVEENPLNGSAAPTFRDIVIPRHNSFDRQDSDGSVDAPVEVKQPRRPVLPDEPEESDPEATRVQIKLEGGKSVVRRFKRSDRVDGLFALVIANLPEANHRSFELMTKFPKKNLSEFKEQTIAEADLLNASCTMRWI